MTPLVRHRTRERTDSENMNDADNDDDDNADDKDDAARATALATIEPQSELAWVVFKRRSAHAKCGWTLSMPRTCMGSVQLKKCPADL